MIRPGIEPRAPGSVANTLPTSSYQKGSFRVTIDYDRQLHFYFL